MAWLLAPAVLLGFVFYRTWFSLPRSGAIPYWASPPVVLLGAPAVAAAAFSLSGPVSSDSLASYFSLAGPSLLGVSAGAILGGLLPRVRKSSRFHPFHPRLWVWVLAGLGLVATAAYVLEVGSPLASSNVELARAGSGNGYLRVLGHASLPAALIAISFRLRARHLVVAISIAGIALFGNRSPLVYLLGAIFIGHHLLKPVPMTSESRPASQVKTRVRPIALFAGLAILSSVVIGGAVLRVILTPDYRHYDEYATPLRTGDYADIGVWSVRHYAYTVGSNAVLTKSLVDSGRMDEFHGASYITGLLTALPGEQFTLDQQIKNAAGAEFIGGGIPPTLAGEGYANFGFAGSFAGSALLALVHTLLGRRSLRPISPLDPYIYGYATIYVCLAQVAGIAGASALPLLFLVLLLSARRFLPKYPPSGEGACPARDRHRLLESRGS